MSKCQAVNLSNRKPCKRTDIQQYTTSDAVVREVCTKHIEQIEAGKTITFHTEGKVRPTTAVISNNDGTTHIDLKSGVEITQERLPLDNNKKEDIVEMFSGEKKVKVFMVKASGAKKLDDGAVRFFYWKDMEVTISQDNLVKVILNHLRADNNDSKFAVVRVDLTTYFGIKADGSITKLSNIMITKSKFSNEDTITDSTPIVKKGIVCGKCTKWEDGTKVEVFHENVEAVKQCYATQVVS